MIQTELKNFIILQINSNKYYNHFDLYRITNNHFKNIEQEQFNKCVMDLIMNDKIIISKHNTYSAASWKKYLGVKKEC